MTAGAGSEKDIMAVFAQKQRIKKGICFRKYLIINMV